MHKVLLSFLISVISLCADAQTLKEVYDNQKLGFELNNQYIRQLVPRYYLSNPQNPTEPPVFFGVGEFSFNVNSVQLNYRYQNTNRRGLYLSYTNLRLADFFVYTYLDRMTNNRKTRDRIKSEIVSSGYIGELNIGANLYVSKNSKFNVSGGLLLQDIKIPDYYFDIGGTHLVVGGFVNVDKIFFNKYVLRMSGYYGEGIVYFDGGKTNERKPYTYRFTTELVHSKGGYIGTDFRGVSHSDRSVIKFGYRFSISQLTNQEIE